MYGYNFIKQPQDTMDNLLDQYNQVIQQHAKMNCQSNQDLFDTLLQQTIFRKENGNLMIRYNYNNQTYVFKIVLIKELNKKYLKKIFEQKEIQRRATKYIQNEFINYKACYIGTVKDTLYFIYQYENFAKNLTYRSNSQSSKGYYFSKLIKDMDRLKIYRNLFQALETFHEEGYYHLNITPKNLLTNIPIEEYSLYSKSQFKIKLGEYAEQKIVCLKNEDYHSFRYIHPQYFIRKKQISVKQLDVYSLSMSLLEIASYEQNSVDQNTFYDNYQKHIQSQYENYSATGIPDSQHRIYQKQFYNYLQSQIESFQPQLKQKLGITDEQQFWFDQMRTACPKRDQIEDCYAEYITKQCKTHLECILYVAIQINPENILSAETMKKVFNNTKDSFINMI